MKKALLILTLIFISISSCSSESDDSSQENEVSEKLLIPKTITINSNNNIRKQNFFYKDSNKLEYTSNSYGFSEHFTYTGNNITHEILYENDTPIVEKYYKYDSVDKLISYTENWIKEPKSTGIFEINYINDNEIIVKSYRPETPNKTYSTKYYFSKSNLVKIEYTDREERFTYDNKQNIHSNILGFNNRLGFKLSKNNLVLEEDIEDGKVINTHKINYEYNQFDFPVKITSSDNPNTEIEISYY